MSDQTRKLVCRAAFLTVCLLPSGLLLWTICSPYFGRLLAGNERDAAKEMASSSVDFKKIPTVLRTEDKVLHKPQVISDASPWSEQQGIHVDPVTVGRVTEVAIENLPAEHLFKELPIQSLRVVELDHVVSFEIDQLDCDLEWIRGYLLSLTSEQVETVLTGGVGQRMFIGKVTVSAQAESGQVVTSRIRGLEVTIDQNAPRRLVVSGRIVVGDESGFESVENPFELTIDRGNGRYSIGLVGSSVPIWLVNSSMLMATGEGSHFSGRYQQNFKDGQQWVSEFSGTINDVECSSLTSAFHPDSRILATGQCQLFVKKLVFQENALASFEGEIQSKSSGEIASAISSLLGSETRWVGDQAVRPFRSFHLVLNYLNQQLQVRSKYQGKLIWTTSGEGVLVSK
ncbi:MAG: hypothetical protein VX438_06590 [Planctomycetota bacterium]|nr:hypothetical protein [Planctomycetota bacterium]